MKWIFACVLLLAIVTQAADQRQWGEAWTRNMVSGEKNLPDSFDPATGRNIRWVAKLGTQNHSTPVVANGRIYVGTNNEEPRDPKHKGDRGVLMCFDEKTGKLLWQLVVPKRDEDNYMDWPRMGICSEATVERDRVYIVSNRGEVICLDARGMKNGNDGPFKDEAWHMTAPADDVALQKTVAGTETRPQPLPPASGRQLLKADGLDADIIWICDLASEADIWPHDSAHSSILIHGNHLYLNTGTGVDNTHKRIQAPDAPSLVVLEKHTGKLVARDDEHIAPDIFHATWSSPSCAEVNGKSLIFFCGGNGFVYGFEPLGKVGISASADSKPATLKKVFQFDFDPAAPKKDIHRYSGNRRESPSSIYGMPVFWRNRLYLAGGGDLWWGKNQCWLKCIDAARTGDVTTNAVFWTYPLQKHVLSTLAIHDGMVFIADCGRMFHCVDAETGQALWTHEIKGEAWASPLVADGKVFLGTRSGNFYVFAARREKKVLSELELTTPISATATAANGVLYVSTMTQLYAIRSGAKK